MGRDLTGISIDMNGISIASVERDRGRVKLLGSWRDSAPIDLGAPAAMKERLVSLLASAGIKRGTVTVSLPDTMARVAILDFQELPAKRTDAEMLIKAGAAKSMNIDVKEYRLDAQTFDLASGKRALCAAVKKQALEPIEEALSDSGLAVKAVSLHSLNIVNLLPEGDGDGSLIARCADFVTVIFFRAGVPDFYRCKAVEENWAESVREVAASFAFYRSRNPETVQGSVYLVDETGYLAARLPESIKAEVTPVGAGFMNSRESTAGVLSALGSYLAYA